ncbi:MAG: hypothetical protein H0U75_04655 [Legionella sp.]|nr:hypothetical protein [Legionella sp.]
MPQIIYPPIEPFIFCRDPYIYESEEEFSDEVIDSVSPKDIDLQEPQVIFLNESYWDDKKNIPHKTYPLIKTNKSFRSSFIYHCNNVIKLISPFFIIPLALAVGLSFGLLIFTFNELCKAYQKDKDFHAKSRRAFVLPSTLIATVAAAFGTFAYISLLAGVILSPLGLSLVIFAAVSIIAALAVLVTKQLAEGLTKPYRLSNILTDPSAVQVQIDNRLSKIKEKGYTFFCSNANKRVRELRQEIYELSQYGIPLNIGCQV